MPFDGAYPLLAPFKAGCPYLLQDRQACGCERKQRSPYCAAHHALCHVVQGSRAERSRLSEIEVVAKFVGGRAELHRFRRGPSDRFMRELNSRLRKQRCCD